MKCGAPSHGDLAVKCRAEAFEWVAVTVTLPDGSRDDAELWLCPDHYSRIVRPVTSCRAPWPLVGAQERLYGFLCAYTDDHGYPPSLREIGRGMHAVDTGRKRTAGDVLSINGIDNSAQIASGARLAMAYGAGRLGENAGYRVTPAEVLAWYGENPSIADGIAASRRLNRDHGVPMSVGTCLHYLFSQASTPSHADEFFDLLSMRVGLPQGSAILALDRALSLEVRTRSVRVAPLRYLALLIKGWNAWLDGRSVQLLRWTAVEDFPEIKRPKFDTVVS
jgi:hypothetical protein